MNLFDLTPPTLAFSPVAGAAQFGLVVMSLALLLGFARLSYGPSLADRVVALDVIATLLVGLLIVHGIAAGETLSLRVATVLALINFVGAVGFALYLGRRSGG